MKNKEGIWMEEDEIRFLTINTNTNKVSKHISIVHGTKSRLFVDIVRFRFHVPYMEGYDVKHLGLTWKNCVGNVENPKFVVFKSRIFQFRFATEIWEGHFTDQYDNGEPGMYLINIQNLTYYVGGGNWNKI